MSKTTSNLVTERSDSLAIGHRASDILNFQIPDFTILDFKISDFVDFQSVEDSR